MDRKCWDQTGQQKCHDGEDGWFGVPIDKNICAEYLDRCAQLWHEHWGNISGLGSRTYPNPVTLKEDARKKVEDLASKLGESHEDTLKARGDYGNVLMEHGERAAASDEFQAVVAAKTKSLGQRHISTLETRHNYALLLGYEMGEIQEAINTMAEVVEGWEEVLGESHRTTKAAARALADWQASGAELQRGAHQSSE